MKITMICDVLGEANNGTTLAALNLIAHLREKGHQLTVVSPDAYRTEAGFVAVPELNLGFLLNKVLQKNGVHLAKPDKRILEKAIRGADVVHLLTPFPLAIAGLKIARRLGIPVTASFHCQAENVTAHLGLMNFRPANALTYRIFYKKVYRYCTAVHYPTDFIRGVFEKSVKHKTPAYVISNGVNNMFVPDPNAVRDPDAPFTIVCCGRYSKEKAQYQLIRALSHSRYADKIRVVFAGTGPWEKSLGFGKAQGDCGAVFVFCERGPCENFADGGFVCTHGACRDRGNCLHGGDLLRADPRDLRFAAQRNAAVCHRRPFAFSHAGSQKPLRDD